MCAILFSCHGPVALSACARITFNVFYGIRIGSGNSLPSHHLVIKINECCLCSCASKSTRMSCSLKFSCMCVRVWAVSVYVPVNMKKYFSRRLNLRKVLTSILMGYFCMINSFIRHCFLLPLQPIPTCPLSLSLSLCFVFLLLSVEPFKRDMSFALI